MIYGDDYWYDHLHAALSLGTCLPAAVVHMVCLPLVVTLLHFEISLTHDVPVQRRRSDKMIGIMLYNDGG